MKVYIDSLDLGFNMHQLWRQNVRFGQEVFRSDQLNVLILDDEKPFTEELNEFFQHSGYKSFEANTWDEAQKIPETEKIDLLILDVRLPKVNGLDILKEVKINYPTIEVIIVSAHGDMDTVIAALRPGAIDYLRKPFRHIDIQIAIERTHKFLQLQREIVHMEEKKFVDIQRIGIKDRKAFDRR